ncbi:hypothetical protein DICVIV_02196 [Dictyocaulus viviparus]|uniref:Pantothenate kinase n=1 Tax=Dictyocaulus viviparus TaxID=29172 RepID=A0A0D8Y4L1_DICVI|nr:hypothetical protein DICVIV_02196 [Dictyocaulus viviparus]
MNFWTKKCHHMVEVASKDDTKLYDDSPNTERQLPNVNLDMMTLLSEDTFKNNRSEIVSIALLSVDTCILTISCEVIQIMGRSGPIRSRKPRSSTELIASRLRFSNKRHRTKSLMDELLLNSNLRRADDVKNGLIRNTQPILREKPTTPFIVLPEEARFTSLVKKSRFALDIGGTLVKLVYSTVCERADSIRCGQPEVLLNFKKFTKIESCLEFIKENWHDRLADDILHCTGGGSFKYAEMMHSFLGVK